MDLNTEEWKREDVEGKMEASSIKGGSPACVVGSCAYFFAVNEEGGSIVDFVWQFDCESKKIGKVKVRGRCPTGRDSGIFNLPGTNVIFGFGGQFGNSYDREFSLSALDLGKCEIVEILPPQKFLQENTLVPFWSTTQVYPTNRSCIQTCVFDGYVWSFGGFARGRKFNDV